MTAALKATLVFRPMKGGKPIHQNCTVSDVAGEYFIFPSGASDMQLPAGTDWLLVDVICTGSGSTTTQAEVFFNDVSASVYLFYASNLNTAVTRQFQANPLPFAGGGRIRLVQRA